MNFRRDFIKFPFDRRPGGQFGPDGIAVVCTVCDAAQGVVWPQPPGMTWSSRHQRDHAQAQNLGWRALELPRGLGVRQAPLLQRCQGQRVCRPHSASCGGGAV